MNFNEKLKRVKEWSMDNIHDIDSFCVTFDITLDDMLQSFPDAMVKSYHSVFPPDVDENLEDEDEQEAWRGYRVFDPENDEG